MTGIERLRKLTDATLGHVHVASVTHYYEDENDVEWDDGMHLSELLASIYSQINREHDAMVADSPHEALPPEDREAIAWVREHGGLSHVKDIYHDLRAVVERLGIEWSESEPHVLMDTLDRRLMPEGCEWPTVDGRKVDFKTSYQPSLGVLEAVSIYNNGAVEVMSHDGIIKPVSEIHVVVLAADGEPLEVGQTVWSVNDGREYPFPCFLHVKRGAEAAVAAHLAGMPCADEVVEDG